MTTDLRDALHALHDDARRGATDLPTHPLVARARRRRTLVRTGYGAAGLGTAAAVVVGGVTLTGRLGRPTPPPPAVTTTAPAPTPTPTPTSDPSPTPSWTPTAEAPFQPDLALCGTTVDNLSGDLQVFTTDAYRADRGAPLTAPYEVDVAGAAGERVTVAPTVAVLVDASPGAAEDQPTVVGVAGQALPGPAARVLDGASEGGGPLASVRLPLTLPFVMCPGMDGAGGTPPDGEYRVWTQVELTKDGTTHSGWGAAFLTVGPEPAPHEARNYLGTGERLDSSLDQSWCGGWTSQAGLSPDQWAATTGALTAEATGWVENGQLVVALDLRNHGPRLASVEVRYPSYYVVTNDPFPWPDGRDSGPFLPPVIVHAGNIGTVDGAPHETLGGPTPSWIPRTALDRGAAIGLETSVGPVTCTQFFGTPWPSGSYTVYAFTEVGLLDGTVTRVQAAPLTVTVP